MSSVAPVLDDAKPGPAAIAASRLGTSHPLGATVGSDGVSFAVYARDATALEVLLFDAPDDDTPSATLALDATRDRTGPYWHTVVPGIASGQVYGYRANGPWEPARGQRFDPRRVLLDPYARGVAIPAGYRREVGEPTAGWVGRSPKSVAVDVSGYDWEGDRPLARPLRETIIYEAHLRGLTANPNSGVRPELRGTYRGLVEKIPYLVDLGVTAIELLPIHQFDRLAAPAGLINYWGYQTLAYFAPHAAYASVSGARAVVDEFRDMVKALHRAGIEVILDVVYNHTAEAGSDGPTLGFRGLADQDYYILTDGGARYADFSGCGNTLDASTSIVRRLILDSLRYWVAEMHVDGFRFDLAAILSRDWEGLPVLNPPLIWDIDTDPVLAGAKLIAEAWDAGGLYQVGSFAGDRWCEWNGRFRDDVRSFVKSDGGLTGHLVQRVLGSPDIYAARGRTAQTTVNFVACHDGFTLNDLVTYSQKHNEANGEGGRDGSDDNHSWDCGVEGPSDDPEVATLRARQVRNMLALTFLSMGVPMLQMGDEVRRTQGGNNNGYCHDDDTTWFDWSLVDRHADLLSFVRRLIELRRRFQLHIGDAGDRSLTEFLADANVELSGVRVGEPDLGPESRSIALTAHAGDAAAHLICNAFWEELEFQLPPSAEGRPWRCILDTSADGPHQVLGYDDAEASGATVRVGPRTIVCLVTSAGLSSGPGGSS
jgi:glycogen operon protein